MQCTLTPINTETKVKDTIIGKIVERLDEDANSLEDYEYVEYYIDETDDEQAFKREASDTLDLITESDVNNIDDLLFKTVGADLAVSDEAADLRSLTNHLINNSTGSVRLESDSAEFGFANIITISGLVNLIFDFSTF